MMCAGFSIPRVQVRSGLVAENNIILKAKRMCFFLRITKYFITIYTIVGFSELARWERIAV